MTMFIYMYIYMCVYLLKDIHLIENKCRIIKIPEFYIYKKS